MKWGVPLHVHLLWIRSHVQRKKRQISTIRKLVFLSAFLLSMLLVVGGLSYRTTMKLSSDLEFMAKSEIPLVRHAGLVDMFHDGIMGVTYRAMLSAGTKDEKASQSIRDESEEMFQNIQKNLDAVEEDTKNPEILKAAADSKPVVVKYIEIARKTVDLALSGKHDQALESLKVTQNAFESLEKLLGDFGDSVAKNAGENVKEALDHSASEKRNEILVVLLGFSLGLSFAIWLITGLRREMRNLVAELRTNSGRVADSAEKLNTVATDLGVATDEQAAALQETAASIEEISAMVKKTAAGADSMSNTAKNSEKIANKGRLSIEKMTTAMTEISDGNALFVGRVTEGNSKITEIVKMIEDIENKTKVINDIVFQTKLLSFNASVEAARAGEHGKGFAVVAEEIGSLAQMSGNAAKEISEILGSSISRVQGIVEETNQTLGAMVTESEEKIRRGLQVTDECGAVFNELISGARSVCELAVEVATATQEQTRGVEEIAKAMGQLDQVTSQNAASSGILSTNANSLTDQSKILFTAVGVAEKSLLGTSDQSAVA